MASDTFAEVVEKLRSGDILLHFDQPSPERELILKAARLLAAAGEYAKVAAKTLDQCVAEKRVAFHPLGELSRARATLDDLAPELKEIA